MKKYVLFIFISINISAYAQTKSSVKCSLKNSSYTNYSVIDFENKQGIYSDTIINNEFEFNLDFKNIGIHYVMFDQENYLVFYPEKDSLVQITFDINNKFETIVKGSKETKYSYQFHEELDKIDADEYFWAEVNKNPNHITFTYYLREFVDVENPNHITKVNQIIEAIGGNHNLSHIKDLAAIFVIKKGNLAPDIEGENQFGQNTSLSKLTGKVVLIDFWASWCKPCRSKNVELINIYKQFKDKGFTIFSYSLDKDKQTWHKAIKTDSIGAWTHICNFNEYESDAVKNYGISGLPHTVLIDKTGVVIGKDMDNKELELILENLL